MTRKDFEKKNNYLLHGFDWENTMEGDDYWVGLELIWMTNCRESK